MKNNEEQYYNKDIGLKPKNQDESPLQVILSASDKLLGQKILDITYTCEEEWDEDANCFIRYPELIIDLSNGSQINVYACVDGTVMVISD